MRLTCTLMLQSLPIVSFFTDTLELASVSATFTACHDVTAVLICLAEI